MRCACDDVAAPPHLNFLFPIRTRPRRRDLDYFVWLIRGGGRDILSIPASRRRGEGALPQAHAESG